MGNRAWAFSFSSSKVMVKRFALLPAVFRYALPLGAAYSGRLFPREKRLLSRQAAEKRWPVRGKHRGFTEETTSTPSRQEPSTARKKRASPPALEGVEMSDYLRRELDKLGELERKVIIARFVGERSQRDVASELNVSQMYISRVERRVLSRMRESYEAQ